MKRMKRTTSTVGSVKNAVLFTCITLLICLQPLLEAYLNRDSRIGASNTFTSFVAGQGRTFGWVLGVMTGVLIRGCFVATRRRLLSPYRAISQSTSPKVQVQIPYPTKQVHHRVAGRDTHSH